MGKAETDAIYFQDLAHEFAADCWCMLGARCDRRVRWAYSAYLPTTRSFAKDVAKTQKDSALMVAIARIGKLRACRYYKRQVIPTALNIDCCPCSGGD